MFFRRRNKTRWDTIRVEYAIYKDHPSGLRPYGQPGPLPIGGFAALLIEFKAQFYKLVTS